MKTTFICLLLLCSAFPSRGAAIAQWNFNSTDVPNQGSGMAALVGGTTVTFATGCTNDPAPSAENKGWNTKSYPSHTLSNKTAGVQFNVSTLGYSDIIVRWDHKVSSSASKYFRLQYSSDGVNFNDSYTPIVAQEVSSSQNYFEGQTNDLSWFTEVNDNVNFAFRIVSEFESSATGAGLDEYVTTYGTNSYSGAGTVRFDMLTVIGTPIPGANTAPVISPVADQTLRVGHSSATLAFKIGDAEDPPEALEVTKASSDVAVIPEGNIVLGGSGSNRTVIVTAGASPGSCLITLGVIDTGSRSNTTSFAVTVLPLNTPPFISAVAGTNTLVDRPAPALPFSIGDMETDANNLFVSALSANPGLVPNDAQHITLGGNGSNRTVTVTPAAGQVGVAPITLTVSDGALTRDSTFAMMVTPSPDVLFYEPFSYPDGSLITNSGFLWDHRSGTYGQAHVTNGQLIISAELTEDVVAHLVGGPYARSNSTVLYTSCKVRLLSVPDASPGYFAHFISGSSLRGRIYISASDALQGCYRLYVANGSTNVTVFPANLSTNTTYQLVTRYDIDSATTALWVNPASENDLHVTANDDQTALSISSYGFRQDADIGATILVDDFRAGLSFAAVIGGTPTPNPVPLNFSRANRAVVLSWSNAAFGLQVASSPLGPFTDVAGVSSPYTNTVTGNAKFFRLRFVSP